MGADPRIVRWIDELATITDEPPGVTRTFLSPALERAKTWLAGWMTSVGLRVFEDEAGNLIGRHDCGNPAASTLACGSHLDSVRNAGRFDGPMGVVVGLLAVERVIASNRPRHHLEVVAFSDEEGVRFQTTYLGSRAYAGRLGADERACTDRDGITVDEAIAAHRPRFPPPPPRRLAGYVEAHIEQGPVLETLGLPLGVVTAIAGQARARVMVRGQAGHAGTTPMALRRDALAGAAECVLRIEELAKAHVGVVATVGQLEVVDAASNVIPGDVGFTVDVRAAEDAVREDFCRRLFADFEARMGARGLYLRVEIPLAAPATACSLRLADELAIIVERRQASCPRLVSGAGHDAVALAEVTDVAMLFVRCRAGLSHHPDEFAGVEDIAAAVDVLAEFIAEFPS